MFTTRLEAAPKILEPFLAIVKLFDAIVVSPPVNVIGDLLHVVAASQLGSLHTLHVLHVGVLHGGCVQCKQRGNL